MRSKVVIPRNIKASFAATGLFPFNPDGVLSTMPKLLPKLTIIEGNKVMVESCAPQDETQSLKTPVFAEGSIPTQTIIIKQNTRASDEMSRQRVLRLVQKLAKAAHMSFRKGALQKNYIRFLINVSNKAKVQLSSKSVALEMTRTMSY